MRGLAEQFLGALLGAWLGATAEIWQRPVHVTIPFIIGLVMIAIFLAIVSDNQQSLQNRGISFIFIVLITIILILLFGYVPGYQLFDNTSQLFFFITLLSGWIITNFLIIGVGRIFPTDTHSKG